MKKLIFIVLISLFFLTGCGKIKEKDVIKEVKKKLNDSSGYQLKGELEITNNDEVYFYDVVVNHKKDDFYKVTLINQSNQFEQIILKNNDGVFLLTPALNKSFKFQSDWPYHNSQVYLLDSILNDLENDQELKFSEKNERFILQSKVDYPNNSKLSYQKITFDQNYQLKKVVVYDQDDVVCMEFTVSKLKYSPKYQDDYFELESIIDVEDDSNKNEVKETSVIQDVIYPLFLPSGTKLVEEEKVSKDSGERVIMTFDGEKSFLLVEETLDVFDEFTIIPSSGEPFQLMDTIGVMTDNSLSWSSGNMEYYLVSDVMSQEELVDIAKSLVLVPSLK